MKNGRTKGEAEMAIRHAVLQFDIEWTPSLVVPFRETLGVERVAGDSWLMCCCA
ncbi:hypothetical protein [Nitrospira sp. M1]